MKICLSCQQHYSAMLTNCEFCQWAPYLSGNFHIYAPELSKANSGFNPSHFAELAKLEMDNFWFRIRNKLIVIFLHKYAPNFKNFFEIGCGTGYVLSGIAEKFPDRSYTGGEIFVEGLSYAAERQRAVMSFLQMDARDIPFINEFDCIGAFDVLEHIKEDTQVLSQINKALSNDGILLLTVPQHQWLWSHTDEIACHVRRYNVNDLHQKIKNAGFTILRSTSFVSTLLPFVIISRLLNKKKKSNSDDYAELRLPRIINSFFEKTLDIEVALIKNGVNFSIGSSRLVVCKKVDV